MKILAKTEHSDIATVYIGEMEGGRLVEFVESTQPPIPRDEKWVLIISSLSGCPVGCRMCDAGHTYNGKLTGEEILSQIDYLIARRFHDGEVPVPKFKVQFARVGEPALNDSVLDVLEKLPAIYNAPGLMPCISTIAPVGTDRFFEKLLEIKKQIYREKFQLQFSIHTTDTEKGDWLIPVRKWSFEKIAEYGESFYDEGGRKVTLNFALGEDIPVEPDILHKHFNPDIFFIKITPINPTYQSIKNGIISKIVPDVEDYALLDELRVMGYEVLLSIGEWEENRIGSNCGQHIMNYLESGERIKGGYSYKLERLQ